MSAAQVGATRVFAGVGIASLAAVGGALISQHVFGMQPCPWCVLQRVIFLAIAIACGLGLIWRSATGRVVAGALGLLLALGGIAAALWQHFQAAASASCNLTLADKIVSGWLGLDSLWPDVFSARASCAEAAVKLLGVPYDFWSLALFVLAGWALLRTLRNGRQR
ncbi:MAG: disulfide bond formation protein B [Burkholderiales bacterium]